MTEISTQGNGSDFFRNNLLAVCDLCETRIGHELNLINHRVTWLAASQSFMFIAEAELINIFLTHQNNLVVLFALFALPVQAIFICYFVIKGIYSAFSVFKELLAERAGLVRALNQVAGTTLKELGPERLTEHFGALPAKAIPVVFLIAWVVTIAVVTCLYFFSPH